MHDDIDYEADTDRRRPLKSTRARSTRLSKTSTTQRRKKATGAIGGKHQRRNKHWSW